MPDLDVSLLTDQDVEYLTVTSEAANRYFFFKNRCPYAQKVLETNNTIFFPHYSAWVTRIVRLIRCRIRESIWRNRMINAC